MIDDYSVKIQYKNKNNEPTGEKVFPFPTYTSMVSSELKKCLNNIEILLAEIYIFIMGQAAVPDKEECKRFIPGYERDDPHYDLRKSPEFMAIRKQLLDAANAIERMPQTVYKDGVPICTQKASDYVANIINEMK